MTKTLNNIGDNSSINVTLEYLNEGGLEEFRIYKENHLYEILKEKIRQTREDKKLSFEEIGRILNKSKQVVALVEDDIGNVDIETLNSILKLLDLDMKISLDFKP